MNFAVIFAGGYGKRMNTDSLPKQFLEHQGKPIIIYTLELFDNHPMIDGIVVACVEEWIPFLQVMIRKFEIKKVQSIVPGGKTGQDSIYNGLKATENLSVSNDDIVLIHDGVRPLITDQTISDNLKKVKEEGSCITCSPTTETFLVEQPTGDLVIPTREYSFVARAPQSFLLKDILAAHEKANRDNQHDFIDSCTMMHHYGYKLGRIIGPSENIKITTPTDFFVFKAMLEAREGQQVFGL